MGYYSWLTCDTNESVANAHTNNCQTVYMLKPNGNSSVKEDSYAGFGVFGGVDAYQWLFEINVAYLSGLARIEPFTVSERREAGVLFQHGFICQDTLTGYLWCLKDDHKYITLLTSPATPIKSFFEWDAGIGGYGRSALELLADGRFILVPISGSTLIQYPIKLSFNSDAKYEDYKASEVCPNQGYFH